MVLNNFRILSIDSNQTYDWLKNKHYAKRIPPIEFSFGLYDLKGIMQGCITFATPVSNPLRNLWNNEFKLMELNRLVVNEGLGKNVLSWFVSNSFKFLPKPLVIVSYADTSKNHTGYIYQATNFIYTGLSAKRTDWKLKGFEHFHGATIADMSRGQENRSQYMREKFGDDFYLEDRSRKHRYFIFLGEKRDKKKMLKMLPYEIQDYPKGENNRYDASYTPNTQGTLF